MEQVSSVRGDRAPNGTSSHLKAILSETNTEPDLALGPCSPREATFSNTPAIPVENIFSMEGTSHLPVFKDKFISSRMFSGITKIEQLEKHHRSHGSKGSSRTSVKAKNSFRISREFGIKGPQPNISTNIPFSLPSFNWESDSRISTSSPKSNNKSSMLTADTELSLSSPAKSCSDLMLHSCSSEAHAFSSNVQPTYKSVLHSIPHDKKDEMIEKLRPRVKELQDQLQEWTEWANQKVMQVARRLGEDKADLKSLKKEKEMQVLEENTLKKLSEIDNALSRTDSQVEFAKAAVCGLRAVNDTLRTEMEAAKSYADASATNFHEVSRREKSLLSNSQLWEKQKSAYH